MYHYFCKNEIVEFALVFILYTSGIDNTTMCCHC